MWLPTLAGDSIHSLSHIYKKIDRWRWFFVYMDRRGGFGVIFGPWWNPYIQKLDVLALDFCIYGLLLSRPRLSLSVGNFGALPVIHGRHAFTKTSLSGYAFDLGFFATPSSSL